MNPRRSVIASRLQLGDAVTRMDGADAPRGDPGGREVGFDGVESSPGTAASSPPEVWGRERVRPAPGDVRAHLQRRRGEPAVVAGAAGLDAGAGEVERPSSAGSVTASNTSCAPDARAISRPCPNSPNPVTSVAPRIPWRIRTSDAARLSVRIWSIAASRSASAVRPWRRPLTSRPVPSASSPQDVARARAALAEQAIRCATPMTASPYFGSGSRIVWPPASIPPASRTSRTRVEDRASAGFGNLRDRRDRSANSTRPPIANTSDSAFAAAISPYATGRRRAAERSRASRGRQALRDQVTAASSGGSRPAMSAPSGSVPAPSPASASESRSAPSFAAQPPHSVSSVRRIGGTRQGARRSSSGRS